MFLNFPSLLPNYSRLRTQGVLGMNQRNIGFVSKYNDRSLYPLVDDKLQTKRLALENEVSVPALIGVVSSPMEVNGLATLLADLAGFCIKPAKGSGGKGILVVRRAEDGQFLRSNGQVISLNDIQRHTSNILAGLFSLGGATDVAMLEQLIEVDDILTRYSIEGVPDIRLIVFRGYPIMAMMRLACQASAGKANLHQGAIGVGLDIANGKAVNAVQNDKVVSTHPDNGEDLTGLSLPHWDRLLELACECYDMSGLGYLGVDLVIDREQGPILLELNARPGLSIQIANSAGLLPRLKKIEAVRRPERKSIEQRIQFAKEHFSSSSALA